MGHLQNAPLFVFNCFLNGPFVSQLWNDLEAICDCAEKTVATFLEQNDTRLQAWQSQQKITTLNVEFMVNISTVCQ